QLSGDLAAAERDYVESRRIAVAINYDENIATSTGNLAGMALDRGDWTAAEALAREALLFAKKVRRDELIAGFSDILARGLIRQGKTAEAKDHAQLSVDIFTRLPSPRRFFAQATLTECESALTGKCLDI
ncbi:MAG: hypothetical protein JWR15_1890, partial [Prosthecobacter sp.]|nr:hypothetical protein [Prosthecobacter sp.]